LELYLDVQKTQTLYDSIKELYINYREKADSQKKIKEDLALKTDDAGKYLEYLESEHKSDSYVFSPRGVVTRNTYTGKNKDTDYVSVIDENAIHQKRDELQELKKKLAESEAAWNDLESTCNILDENMKVLSSLLDSLSKKNKEDKKEELHIIFQSYEKDHDYIKKLIKENVISDLSYVTHTSKLISSYIDSDPNRAKLELQKLSECVCKVMDDLRDIVYLMEPIVPDKTIEKDLKDLLDSLKQISPDLEVNYFLNGILEIDDFYKKISILQIVRELCLNVCKHAKAMKLLITLKEDENFYILDVEDNGIGFNYQKVVNNDSCKGLKMISQRIDLWKGSLDIKPGKFDGTVVTITIPKEAP